MLGGSEDHSYENRSGRLDLARSISAADNPLTARVYVNRIWSHLIGSAIVETPSDFGSRSSLPTHPELLDHLASSLIKSGWSSKTLIRSIVLSSTYQQASRDRSEPFQVDPENKLLWKMNRKRLEFEPLRDAVLAVAASLDPTTGGRPVDLFKPPYSNRRSIYGFVDRQNLPATLRIFDFASPDTSCPERPETTVPQQALFLMNSPFVLQQANALVNQPSFQALSEIQRIRSLYVRMFGREPTSDEVVTGQRYVAQAPVAEIGGWSYGYGRISPDGQRVESFTPMRHWVDNGWRGGEKLPDPVTGWVFLNAQGGHPGASPDYAAIRRWVAPEANSIRILGRINHASDKGNGVRGSIVSASGGLLGQWESKHGSSVTKVGPLSVAAGETIDFVVEDNGDTSFDSFEWAPVIIATDNSSRWSSRAEFSGVSEGPGPWQKYVQVLLMTNEFAFVD